MSLQKIPQPQHAPVLRTEKLKSMQAIRRALVHNVRAHIPANADPERAKCNIIPEGMSTVTSCLAKFEQTLGTHQPRANAVYAREFIVSGSRERLKELSDKELKNYFLDALRFCDKIFGRENLISFAVHFDELTPHSHMIYSCMVDGRLNDTSKMGGHRDHLSILQQKFATEVGAKYGFKLKPKAEKATHKTIKQGRQELPELIEKQKSEIKQQAAQLRSIADSCKRRQIQLNTLNEEYNKKEGLVKILTSQITNLEQKLKEIKRDIADYSRYAASLLKERMVSYFGYNFDRQSGRFVRVQEPEQAEGLEFTTELEPEIDRPRRSLRR